MKNVNRYTKRCVAFGMFLTLIISSLVFPVNAAELDNYDLYGYQLSRGIENVQCINHVDQSVYPEMYLAVQDAIRDWDWHLGVLNTQYGVDWNISDVTGQQTSRVPEIQIYTMTDDQVKNAYGENFFEKNGYDVLGFTVFYSGNQTNSINPNYSNWLTNKIVLCVDKLAQPYPDYYPDVSILHDYSELKQTINHEIGHALGLDHYSADAGVLMYDRKLFCTADVPTASDLHGIYLIYS